jgi:hypothetical protein
MKHIKFAAGAVFVGAVAAALIGGGTASAAPGVQVAAGDTTFGIGDQSEDGAQAFAKPGNTAVAVSIFGSARADASQGGSETFGEGNNVLAIGSNVEFGPQSAGNNVVATGGAVVRVNGTHNNVLAVAGETKVVKKAAGDNVVTVCGARVSGQADSIKASPGGC